MAFTYDCGSNANGPAILSWISGSSAASRMACCPTLVGNPILRALATLTRAVAYLIVLLIVATVLSVFFLFLAFATAVL
jgi:hypothetical protein